MSDHEKYLMLDTSQVKKHLELIIRSEIPLRRQRKDGSYGYIPPREFDMYLKQQDMLFFVDREIFQKAVERNSPASATPAAAPEEKPVPRKTDSVYRRVLDDAAGMDVVERIQSLMNSRSKLRGMASEGRRLDEMLIAETAEIFSSALSYNRVTYEEKIAGAVTPSQVQQLVAGSYELIGSLIGLMSAGKASYRDLSQLQSIDTGSPTLDHITRILYRYISFLFFYNSYFQKHSAEVKKFRAFFQKKYAPYYRKIDAHGDITSLELVFRGGIAPVSDRKQFLDYVLSGFMHDIGKLPEIQYHDGNAGNHDTRTAARHVFDGYNLLAESGQFGLGPVSMPLLHHDYYGMALPKGYNQLPTFRRKFVDRRGPQRERVSSIYCISHSINDVGFGSAMAYFPNKVMEILDLYDTACGARVEPEQALAAIRAEYLDGDVLGIDPVLFDIFIDFVVAGGEIANPATIRSLRIMERSPDA
jgi:hypothetical protein